MDAETTKLKIRFESWLTYQFPEGAGEPSGREVLKQSPFDDSEGYPSEQLNTLWLGFCAGYLVATL